MTATVARPDRRHRRREQTLAEVVDVAVQVMAEQGVAGLTLGEVARRMGIRPPSLYGYFPSKNALYDAIFARGWRELMAAMREQTGAAHYPEFDSAGSPAELARYLADFATAYVRWSVEHPAFAQLMAWRPVPGYEPSAAAYAPAVEALAEAQAVFARLQQRGLLRSDVAVEHLLRAWTVVTGGVVSQQLANAPHEAYEGGTFTALLPELVTMYLGQYGSRAPHDRSRRRLTKETP